ncbi:MAG: ABC transporter permease [Pseudomonadota bacterium]
MQIVNIAWRNLQRNKRRSLLTLLATATGVVALLAIWSVFDGNALKMIQDQSGVFTGHLQIHRAGYDRDPSLDLTFTPRDIAELDLQSAPGVAAFAPRLAGRALISSENSSRGVFLVGVHPRQETAVTTLHERITNGQALEDGENGGILIGKPLAKALKLVVGDEVAVVTQGLRGSFGSQRYRVRGIFDTQNEAADNAQVFVTLEDADELFAAQGEVTTVAAKLQNHDLSLTLAPALGGRLGKQWEVLDWKQLLPSVAQYIALHDAVVSLLMVVLVAILAMSIANTILMSIIERMREFGVMLAIGTSPLQIFRLVLYEGLFIGVLGLCIGIVLVYVPVAYFSTVGIPMGASTQAVQAMQSQGAKTTSMLYPHLAGARVLVLTGIVVFVTALATAYPAWQAARIVPVRAMQGLVGQRAVQSSSRLSHWLARRFLLLTLALRNFGRHPLRSALTVSSVAFGMAALVFLSSVGSGYFTQVVENATGLVTGDAQIQHKNFRVRKDLSLSLHDSKQLLHGLSRIPQVVAASPRIEVEASISTALQAEPMTLVGVDPQLEPQVTFLSKGIKQGHYLAAGQDRDIVIGRKLADLLGVKIGEKVVVTAANRAGFLTTEALRVAGIFDTGSHGSDRGLGYVNLGKAQSMLGMDDRVTSIALRVQDREQLEPVLQQVRTAMSHEDEIVLAWQDLLPDMAQISQVFQRALLIVLGIVVAMVAMLVMNTMLMSVLERTREFGVMLAIGSPPQAIVRLVCLEAGIIGIAGTVLGLLLGGLVVWAHLKKGISLAAHGGTAVVGVTNVVYPKIEFLFLLQAGLVLPVLVLMASLYPAFRASRLEPVQAIRHV